MLKLASTDRLWLSKLFIWSGILVVLSLLVQGVAAFSMLEMINKGDQDFNYKNATWFREDYEAFSSNTWLGPLSEATDMKAGMGFGLIALFLWGCYIIQSLRSLLTFVAIIFVKEDDGGDDGDDVVPDCKYTDDNLVVHKYRFADSYVKAVVVVVGIARFIILCALAINGMYFLSYIDDMKDFILNCLALTFISDIPELIFNSFASNADKEDVDAFNRMETPLEISILALFWFWSGVVSLLVILPIVIYVWDVDMRQFQRDLVCTVYHSHNPKFCKTSAAPSSNTSNATL